jgi:hypothetical protein
MPATAHAPRFICCFLSAFLQVAMPLYQFTSEHNVLEAARRLLQSGSTSFKFDLKNQRANGKPIKVRQQRYFYHNVELLVTIDAASTYSSS